MDVPGERFARISVKFYQKPDKNMLSVIYVKLRNNTVIIKKNYTKMLWREIAGDELLTKLEGGKCRYRNIAVSRQARLCFAFKASPEFGTYRTIVSLAYVVR